MPGILNAGGPPPAPNPQPAMPSTAQGMLSAPNTGAPPGLLQLRQPYFPGAPQPTFAAPPAAAPPGGQGPVAGAAAPQQQQPPPPTYGQALASLRHFSAIHREVHRVLRDPTTGVSNVKPKIVDAIANLVADRILTAAAAVEQLTNVPDRPFDQKQWLIQQAVLADQAEENVLAHYRQGIANMSPEEIETMDKTGDASTHLSDIATLTQQYGRGRRA